MFLFVLEFFFLVDSSIFTVSGPHKTEKRN